MSKRAAVLDAFRADRSDRSATLRRRVQRLGRVFALEPITAQGMGAAQVVEYYELCFGAFRRRHSSEGSLHMALNEGRRFDAAGFGGQAERLLALWAAQRPLQVPADVLELGFGHGYNLGWLAPRLPATRCAGIDLTQRHVEHVRTRCGELGLANVELQHGDFHTLPYADASVDHVYSVEAFCYATDTPRALAQVARVLRPGGTLTLYDGYLTRPLAALDAHEAIAVRLAAKGMAMDSLPVADELLAQATAAGFTLERRVVLDRLVMPNVRRLESLTGVFVRWPWLARRTLARLNPVAMRNVLAGYLMGAALQSGLWTYLEIVLRKRAD